MCNIDILIFWTAFCYKDVTYDVVQLTIEIQDVEDEVTPLIQNYLLYEQNDILLQR